jgi:hypothetical protein
MAEVNSLGECRASESDAAPVAPAQGAQPSAENRRIPGLFRTDYRAERMSVWAMLAERVGFEPSIRRSVIGVEIASSASQQAVLSRQDATAYDARLTAAEHKLPTPPPAALPRSLRDQQAIGREMIAFLQAGESWADRPDSGRATGASAKQLGRHHPRCRSRRAPGSTRGGGERRSGLARASEQRREHHAGRLDLLTAYAGWNSGSRRGSTTPRSGDAFVGQYDTARLDVRREPGFSDAKRLAGSSAALGPRGLPVHLASATTFASPRPRTRSSSRAQAPSAARFSSP